MTETLKPDNLHPDLYSVLGQMWREACDRGSHVNFRIMSDSMKPLINSGDVVTITRAEPARLRIGDVAAFHHSDTVIVHRIIGRRGSPPTFRHMGDAGNISTNAAAAQVIGRVSAVKKPGRHIDLDSPRYRMANPVMGWRLRLVDSINGRLPGKPGRCLRLLFRPLWRLCRDIMLRP